MCSARLAEVSKYGGGQPILCTLIVKVALIMTPVIPDSWGSS
jgi:hypothetical protein